MSQITRCPACATMFRVADGQLKVAQGWVRCGQCGEVFNASVQLLPCDAAGPAIVAFTPAMKHEPPAVEPVVQAPAMPLAPSDVTPPVPAPELPGLAPSVPTQGFFRQEQPQSAEAVAFDALAPDVPAFQQASFKAGHEAPPDLTFMRDAQRKAFWASAPVRAVLALLCLVLLAALALQWVVYQRDLLSAQAPRLAPMLQGLCRPLGCTVRPLRRIEALVIDSASFSKTAADAYRLTFVLKNTGALALEVPALEVTLTDSQDQPLVRRVVMPEQFGATALTLDGHSELAGALSLKITGASGLEASPAAQAGRLPVAGYRILAFYP
ncbi:MAG: family finger-like protein [Polaromonas sp.]|nr:family finger-like protein [Polaromonas sp.]